MSAANSTQTALRVVGRPFRPGESGNVNGRPKRDAEFAAACRERAPRILAMLEKSLRSSSWREQHSAAVILLNYAFGRPGPSSQQPIEDAASPGQLHLIAATLMGQELLAEQERRTGLIGHAEPIADEPQIVDLSAPPPLE